jgi:hypothetical protein
MTDHIQLELSLQDSRFLSWILDCHLEDIERDPERNLSPEHRAEFDQAAAKVKRIQRELLNAFMAAGGELAGGAL